ncbi:MAG: SDR family NAD(P)-dependent oxidoreductase, partial [Myxococcota bacterium]|nr:SDR family NAD(P)-dependent oxidoreductase [Myxococcota bacterium]
TYDAVLTLNGPLSVFDSLLGVAFERLGDRAADGLKRVLSQPRPERAVSGDVAPSSWVEMLDAALELSVVGSFTRVGPALRRRFDAWHSLEGARLDGRVVVLSGATSGLGLEAARAFALMGASVEIIARNSEKAEACCAELRLQTVNEDINFVVADLGDLEAVRRAATELLERHATIDVLVHNAGALDHQHAYSPQGNEQTVASQVLGPFLLTSLLLPALRAATPSRILWVSSGGMYAEPLSVQQLEMGPEDYDGVTAYARAKRAQVTLAELMALRLTNEGVAVHAMHPGWADTPGVARSLPKFRRALEPLLRTPAEGVDTLLWLAVDPTTPLQQTGRFWLDRRERPVHRLAKTRRADTLAERQRLWEWALAKSGLERF